MESSSEGVRTAPRDRIALPFAVIGAAGGGLVAHLLSGGYRMSDARFTVLLVVSTAAVAGLLGRLLERHLGACTWNERYTRTIFSALLAGAVNGGLIYAGVVIASERAHPEALIGLPFAGIFGAVVAVPFLVPLCLTVRASATANDAREGSIAFDSRRRAVWRVVAGSISVACLFGIPRPNGMKQALLHHWPTQLTLVCLAVVAWSTILELVEARRTRILRSTHESFHLASDRDAIPSSVPRLVDYGLGGEVRVETAPGVLAYRTADEARRVALGDPALALRDLRHAATVGAIALVLCGLTLVCQLAAAAKQPSKMDYTSTGIFIDAHVD